MADREKVIKGMECCLHMLLDSGESHCHECPYNDLILNHGCDNPVYCIKDYVLDALALLKEQEEAETHKARLLTLEEVTHLAAETDVWIERPDYGITVDTFYVLDECGVEERFCTYANSLRLVDYGKLWRCWSARPSDAQRKEAKWDAAD